MLARLHRFHGHNSVRNAYRQGRSVRGSIGSLHVFTDSKKPTFKVAVVVSKKVHKSAVIRNRIRRRIYEIIRIVAPKLRQPSQLVFTIYSVDVATMPHSELKEHVDNLLKRAKLL